MAPGGTVCQLKLTSPVLESQLDQVLSAKRAELRTKKNLPRAFGNGKKEDQNGVPMGTTPVFLIPKCWWKFTPESTAATNSAKKQNSMECI